MFYNFTSKAGSVRIQNPEHGNIHRCPDIKPKTFGPVSTPESVICSPSNRENKIDTQIFMSNASQAVLGRRLVDVAQAEGPVSQEYLRTHVQELEEALAKAREIGLRDEFLVNSAAAELQSSKLILEHATAMQSCIDENPLKGCGAGVCVCVRVYVQRMNVGFFCLMVFLSGMYVSIGMSTSSFALNICDCP